MLYGFHLKNKKPQSSAESKGQDNLHTEQPVSESLRVTFKTLLGIT